METSELLEYESDWITALILMQLFKVVFFTLWQLYLQDTLNSEDDSIAQYFRKDQNMSSFKSPRQTKQHELGKYCSMGIRLKKDNESEDEELIHKEDPDYFYPDNTEDIEYDVIDVDLE